MKILVLDRHAMAAVQMVDFLREEGHHEVINAFNINDANSHWQYDGSPFDCLIVDITGPVDGLTEEEKNQTKEGWISGWIWLKNYILKEKPAFTPRVIIYSTQQTLQVLEEADPKAMKSGVSIICKNGSTSGVKLMLAQLEKISKLS
ncbi:MAG: hypothetical protein NTX82_04385 [Candidatus Parcubacteria bacterium]|nr:hypothetical protein [Candidatus Parcubacteria bacterium]